MRITALLLLLASTALAADKPNIIVIIADDLGRHDVGFMGGTQIKTPHLDALAKKGAILDAHYVQPVCSPTRAALLTGRYPMRHGLQVGVVRPWAQYGLPLEERTLPQALKEAGYVTHIVGKWHLGHFAPEYLPTRRGFDHQYGHYNGALDYHTHIRDGGFDWHRDDKVNRDEGYATTLLGNEAVRIIEKSETAKPFFLYMAFNAPHAPLQALPEHEKLYEDIRNRKRRTYAAMVHAVDEQVGRISAAIDKRGIAQNTLIVFSSDNGGPLGQGATNGPWRAGKGTLYEGGVRVAAFATWQGKITGGSSVKAPIHVSDWYPTLLKLAGAAPEQKLPIDGLDIWPTLAEGKPSPHDAILINSTPNGGAIRMGDFKLVAGGTAPVDEDGAAQADTRGVVELFNLADDPYEKTNLAQAQPEKARELRDRLAGYAKHAVAPKAAPKAGDFKTPAVWGEN